MSHLDTDEALYEDSIISEENEERKKERKKTYMYCNWSTSFRRKTISYKRTFRLIDTSSSTTIGLKIHPGTTLRLKEKKIFRRIVALFFQSFLLPNRLNFHNS